ncbi:rubrerythrin-like domain-containing protein [Haloterrigena turkmenica]|nr:rubrerythrin-like domain-containing protein [Haloterrigena turkmenica]
MFDVQEDAETESTYECLQCGEIAKAASHPVNCPNCGKVMQNQTNSLE